MAQSPGAPAPAPAPAPLLAPTEFRFAAPFEVLVRATLVGQAVLYLWPDKGCVRGTVARRSRTAGYSHVVRYGRTSVLCPVTSSSLLDGALHGPARRWVLLLPAR